MDSRKIITGISVAMFVTGVLRADMMPAVAYGGALRQGDVFCVSPALSSRLSRLPWEFGLRPGNRRQLYAAASFLSSSVAIALINCGS